MVLVIQTHHYDAPYFLFFFFLEVQAFVLGKRLYVQNKRERDKKEKIIVISNATMPFVSLLGH